MTTTEKPLPWPGFPELPDPPAGGHPVPMLVSIPDGATDVVVRGDQSGSLRMHWHGAGAFQWNYDHTPGDGTFADRTEIVSRHCIEADVITGPMDLDAIMARMREYIEAAMRGRLFLGFDMTTTITTQSEIATN